jgi:hypothetical protein
VPLFLTRFDAGTRIPPARDGQHCWQCCPLENLGKFDPANGERRSGRSQPIQNLVSPETLKPVQRRVKRGQLIKTEAADLLDRAYVLLVERINGVAYLATFAGQLDAHRAPIEAGALVVEKANLGELLEVVGDV